ncbi:deSI-like protein-like [Dorcoceras hygrometricum]|uniref:DeSI-like protein-like n=1 Tax=Dorcoceras hygrometricum TaxID=472368 RepID=A0A2Z7D6Z9_9LAMI|nr:deSI-like protein-like [Dorcoceras hygrometricum]
MKSKIKVMGRSVVPLNVQRNFASRFCVFPHVEFENYNPGQAPVYLNIYDISPLNAYLYWAGIGVFHSGLEVHGVEYAFGALDYPTTGIFEVEPRHYPGFRFRESIYVGTTYLNPRQVKEFFKCQSRNYYGNSYHLVVKNCNHFSEDMCYQLTRNRIPKWVNRLARLGSLCNGILPRTLQSTKLFDHGNDQDSECENKSLRRSSVNCVSSISMDQIEREVSVSSIFLNLHYKDCLPPLDLKIEAPFKKFFFLSLTPNGLCFDFYS